MPTARTGLRLVVFQVRGHRTSLLQEQSCFIESCRVARGQITFINLVDQPLVGWSDVADAHAVLIGGAGAYSVTKEHPFTAPLADVVAELIERERPLFGSCWGHQFLVRASGGTVVEDPDQREVGTFLVSLTSGGLNDPLFAEVPPRFRVQLGHNDSVGALGEGWIELATSERSRYQAVRLADKPVYGTQFHPELDDERLRQRLLVYLDDYVSDAEEYDRIIRGLRPSIDADGLLARFLDLYA